MSPFTSTSRPEAHPRLLVDVVDEAAQAGRVLDAVLSLAEDDPDHAALLLQLLQGLTVLALQRLALQLVTVLIL
jgi:hypothetical protein